MKWSFRRRAAIQGLRLIAEQVAGSGYAVLFNTGSAPSRAAATLTKQAGGGRIPAGQQ